MDTVENNFFLSQTWTIHFFFFSIQYSIFKHDIDMLQGKSELVRQSSYSLYQKVSHQ